MQAGFFETDITPPVGTEQAGGYGKMLVQSIHDPLKVQAAFFANDTVKVALIGVDTCFIGFDIVEKVREQLRERCGIPAANCIIGASHTHGGGAITGMVDVKSQDDIPDHIRHLLTRRSAFPDPDYREWVVKQIVTAAVNADARKENARLNSGTGCETGMIFNRRFKMKNGRCCTHPGKVNPDIIEPAGGTDPEVGVIGAWRGDGSLIGCIVNYSCHGTCNNRGGVVSADWIHYLRKTIRAIMGDEAGVVFLNGACGDVTQVNNLSASCDWGFPVAWKLGTRVGAEAVKALLQAEPAEYHELSGNSTVLELKRRRPSPASVEKSWSVLNANPDNSMDTEVLFAKERVLADFICRREPVVKFSVNVVKIGNVAIFANPAEYFVGLGLKIKKLSPVKSTWIASLANGSIGYIPDTADFASDGGGYETALTSYSNLEITAGEKITEVGLKLLAAIKPEKIDTPPLPVGIPWEYGDLGPDSE
jgi:hypothetical protein